MADAASLPRIDRDDAIAERVERIRANGVTDAVVDVSDLTLDIDAVLAEISTFTGVTVERVSPITGRTADNVVPIRPSPAEDPS